MLKLTMSILYTNSTQRILQTLCNVWYWANGLSVILMYLVRISRIWRYAAHYCSFLKTEITAPHAFTESWSNAGSMIGKGLILENIKLAPNYNYHVVTTAGVNYIWLVHITIWSIRPRIIVQVTIYYTLLIGRDGHQYGIRTWLLRSTLVSSLTFFLV